MRTALTVALVIGIAGCKNAGRNDPGGEPLSGSATNRGTAPGDHDAGARVPVELPPPPPIPVPSLGLPRPPTTHSTSSPETVALGELLFWDPRVWRGPRACAGCHRPERGFTSGTPLTQTRGGKTNQRHTPTLFDLAYQRRFYWDGRATSIQALATGHVIGQLAADLEEVAERLVLDPVWSAHFNRAFSGPPTAARIADALAAYSSSRFSPTSPWDRYEAGESSAVGDSAVRGSDVFNERAGCAVCHPPPLYTDLSFHASSVPPDVGPPDRGRARLTGMPGDERAFKTPSLRGLAHTAPYLHAGTAATLELAVDSELGRIDPGLTAEEKADLLAFLRSLSGELPPRYDAKPALP